jgi:hypothetical protein
MIRTIVEWKSNAAAGTICAGRERGRRRTRQDQISPRRKIAGEIAEQNPHRTKKTVSSAGPVFEKSELLENTIQPFDLMSRRHPLSSTRAIGFKSAPRSKSS